MDTLGCVFAFFIFACVMAFFAVAGLWMLIGTIILISKLIVWMAYVGGAFVLLGLVAFLVVKCVGALSR